MLKDKDINLIQNIDEESVKIKLVKGELTQVLINIINNAKDALVERHVENPWIKIELKKQKEHALITIEDNAGGIPKDILPKIFDQYFTTKDDEKGTGLGLHMSYQIINDSFKGNLYVENSPFGAKFFIDIPLKDNI